MGMGMGMGIEGHTSQARRLNTRTYDECEKRVTKEGDSPDMYVCDDGGDVV